MIITVTGNPGSGKTTVAKIVSERMGYKHVSMGNIRREIAKKHGLTINELNKIGESEDWTDKEPDDYLKNLGEKEDNLVIDTWTGFHFIPKSLKIFVKCDPQKAAERIFKDQRDSEEKNDNVEDMRRKSDMRWEQSRQRYLKWYGFDINDMSNYDVIIDSTEISPDEVAKKIIDEVAKKK